MKYWTQQCEGAIALTPHVGAQMPLALSMEQLYEIAEDLPGPVERLLAQRGCLAWEIIGGNDIEYEAPPANKFVEGVIDHKAVHTLHRDSSARFIWALEPRPDTLVIHEDVFPAAYNAGLVELRRYSFLRPAIEEAISHFNQKPGELETDHSIFLARSLARKLLHLNINPIEEKRILAAYQGAVIRAAEGYIYSHSHKTPKLEPVKQGLLLGQRTPHMKHLESSSNLAQLETRLALQNVVKKAA